MLSRGPAFLLCIFLSACSALPGGTVVDEATVVYTAGSSRYTAAVKIHRAAPEVYAALIDVVTEEPDVEIVNRKNNALLVEVTQKDRELTGQVTTLGKSDSLLYIWADTGASGQTGQELALIVVGLVCDKLGVTYELVSY